MAVDYKIYNGIPKFNRNKFTVVGTPTVTDDGVASGFSSSNYLKINSAIRSSNWAIEASIIPAENIATDRAQTICSEVDSEQNVLFNFRILKNGKDVELNIQNVISATWLNVLVLEKPQKVKLIYKDKTLYLEINGILNPKTVSVDLDTFTTTNTLWIGYNSWKSLQVFYGSIDLKNFSIESDGKEIFKGTDLIPESMSVIGTPTITDDGVLTNCSGNNYVSNTYKLGLASATSFSIEGSFVYNKASTHNSGIFNMPNDNNPNTANKGCYAWITPTGYFNYTIGYDTAQPGATGISSLNKCYLEIGDTVKFKIKYNNGSCEFLVSRNDSEYIQYVNTNVGNIYIYPDQSLLTLGRMGTGRDIEDNVSINLKDLLITADGVEVLSGSHNASVVEKLQYLKDSKEIIRQSIEDKGVEVPEETPFRQYADKISEIKTGSAYQKMFSLLNIGNTVNVTDDGILTCVSTQNSFNDKVCIAYRANITYYGFTAECKFNMSSINSTPNIVIGGSQNNCFVIGVEPSSSDCIGIWYKDNRNYTYTPATEHGITPIQTNKDYWLRFTYKCNTYSSSYTYTIEMKENKDDEYHLEWTSPRNNQINTHTNNVYFGGGYYANTTFSFDGTVDLKECSVIPHPGTGVVVNVGG